MIIYRGYSFKTEKELEKARESILKEGDCRWKGVPNIKLHHRKRINKIIEELKSLAENEKEAPERSLNDGITFVASDIGTARFYASREKSKPYPLLMKADVDEKKLFIDGRDILFNFIAGLKRFDFSDVILEAFAGAYGEKGVEYLIKSEGLGDLPPDCKFRYVDYMITDDAVINAHINSVTMIYGRYETKFKNALILKDGIPAKSIIQLDVPSAFTEPEEKPKYRLPSVYTLRELYCSE